MSTTPPNPPDHAGPARPHMRIEMLSCPKYLAGARELVASLARRLGFEESAACQIALAVDEALANVMRHGYQRREDQPIWMSIWQLGDQAPNPDDAPRPDDDTRPGLRIVIEDRGRQADPQTIKGRDLDDIRPGGLGVHIIRQVMDQVLYEKRDGGGMRLTLVKRLEQGNDGHSDATNDPAPPGGNDHG